MKMLILVIAVLAICASLTFGLGFNTIEWMTQRPGQPAIWYFIYGSSLLSMPFWWAYFLGGILPLWGSGIFAGVILGLALHRRRTAQKTGSTSVSTNWRSMTFKKGLAITLFVTAFASVVFLAIDALFLKLDISTVDPILQPVVTTLKRFFTEEPVVLFAAWLTNISGFIIIFAKKKAIDEGLTYDIYKYYGLLAMYLGIGTTLALALPDPYGKIGLAVIGAAKLLETSFSKVAPAKPADTEKTSSPVPS